MPSEWRRCGWSGCNNWQNQRKWDFGSEDRLSSGELCSTTMRCELVNWFSNSSWPHLCEARHSVSVWLTRISQGTLSRVCSDFRYQQHFFSALYQFTSFLSAADLALHVFQSSRSFKWPDLLLAGWIILSPAWRLSKSRENGLRNIDSYRLLGKELTCDWTCTRSGWGQEERGCLWSRKSSWLNWTESWAGLSSG